MSEMCARLHRACRGLLPFSFPFDETKISQNGIYVLFEDGEMGHARNRIVRVGTHTGENQLRARLNQHFVGANKDRSIFRKNIGRAILHRDQDPFVAQWELDLTTSEARKKHGSLIDLERQAMVEQQVTDYIQKNFHFVVLHVESKDVRLELEARMISTVSLCRECGPSEDWLGLHSPKAKIRTSGMWQVNSLSGEPLSDSNWASLEPLESPEDSG